MTAPANASRFRGSFTALVTPFAQGAPDEAKFREHVSWQIAEGTEGLIPVGTTGESPTLSHDEHKRVVEMDGLITVSELAHQMAVKSGQLIQKLFSMGMMVTVNQTIDFETASIVASEFGFEVKNVAFTEENLTETPVAEPGTAGPPELAGTPEAACRRWTRQVSTATPPDAGGGPGRFAR